MPTRYVMRSRDWVLLATAIGCELTVIYFGTYGAPIMLIGLFVVLYLACIAVFVSGGKLPAERTK